MKDHVSENIRVTIKKEPICQDHLLFIQFISYATHYWGGARRLLSSESMILHAGILYPFEVCTLLVNHGYTRDECAFSRTGRARLI